MAIPEEFDLPLSEDEQTRKERVEIALIALLEVATDGLLTPVILARVASGGRSLGVKVAKLLEKYGPETKIGKKLRQILDKINLRYMASLEREAVQLIRNKGGLDLKDGIVEQGIRISRGKVLQNGKPVTGDFDFVVGVDNQLRIGFRHEYLAKAGGNTRVVQAAGTLEIRNGKITKITNLSGHFKPYVSHGLQYESILRKRVGVNLDGTNLILHEEYFWNGNLLDGYWSKQ